MTLGLTIGKFNPLHVGHDFVISTAKAEADHVVVIIGERPSDTVPAPVRASWIAELHPDVEVIITPEDIPDAPDPWAERTRELLPGRKVDLVFTSEDYGDRYAERLGAQHVPVDPARKRVPASGTALRADLAAHWEHLTPPAKAHFARRVCVTGVESSGSTTLAAELARHYATVWVPEHGRWYWEGRRHTPDADHWQTWEFTSIARAQQELEDTLARRANRLVVCDTDALTTHVWHRRYTGRYAPEVEAIADTRAYDLYLVTLPDFPFVQDGTREGEGIRDTMHSWLVDVLERKGHRHAALGGRPADRLAAAVRLIDDLLVFPKLT